MGVMWYVSRNGLQYGPYTLDQVKEAIVAKNIVSGDHLRNSSMDAWVEGRTLLDLFPVDSQGLVRSVANPFTVQCPTCNRTMRIAARFAGQTMKCLHCPSRIQVPAQRPPISREGRISFVRAICNVSGEAFAIQFRQLGNEGWVAERARKRSQDASEPTYGFESLKGNICMDVSYSGCPYCADKSYYRCGLCNTLNCQGAAAKNEDGKIIVCCANPHCDGSGELSGAIEELSGSREK